MGTEKLVDPETQIKGPFTFWKLHRRCSFPLCGPPRQPASYVSHGGQFIWCEDHAPFEEEW